MTPEEKTIVDKYTIGMIPIKDLQSLLNDIDVSGIVNQLDSHSKGLLTRLRATCFRYRHQYKESGGLQLIQVGTGNKASSHKQEDSNAP